ncbi:MAG: putative membrane protein [Polaribacter sp.]|jgi:uncharacterized membrane protein
MVIHFPIALVLVGFLSELIGLFTKKQFFKNASFYLLLLGALGAIVAFVSGSYTGDGMTTDGILQVPLTIHEDVAIITLWLAIKTALLRTAMYYFKYQKPLLKWI